jgi:hypothetical protein
VTVSLRCDKCDYKLTKEFFVSTMMQENKFDEEDLPF